MVKRAIILLGIVLVFCLPILANLDSLGRGDWDQFFFYSEVPQVSVYQYHQFPFWNPYYCGGVPVMGNPQTRFFSPSFIFTSLFGVVTGLKLEIMFFLFFGFMGMYFLSRYLKMGSVAAILPGIIFLFNGALVLHLTEGHFTFLPVMYLPWAFLFFIKGLESRWCMPVSSLLFALMIYQGGTYVAIFSAIALVVFMLVMSSVTGKQRLTYLAWFFLLAFFMAAPKIFPVIDYFSQYPRPTGLAPSITLACLNDMFFKQCGMSHITAACFKNFGSMGWWEIGAYVGPLVAILFLLSWRLFWERMGFLLAGSAMLLLSVGTPWGWVPWNILHQIPPFSNMLIPTRALVVFMFFLSLMAGFYVDRILKGIRREYWKLAAGFVIIGLVFFDLLYVNGPVFSQAFTRYRVPFDQQLKLGSPAPLASDFIQERFSDMERFRYGAWSSMHHALLRNRGTINGYESIPVKVYARAAGDAGYRGEYYLQSGRGKVAQAFWSPNRLVFRLKADADDQLIVNQNFEKNWKSSAGKVESCEGLICIKVGAGEQVVSFWYFPYSFMLGGFVFLVGVLLSFYWAGVRRRHIINFFRQIKLPLARRGSV